MPLTETVKPSDGAKKKSTDNTVDGLSKKRSGRVRESTIENQSRGDDLSPSRGGSSKNSVAKKGASDIIEKRVKTPVTDKVPKKSIQRAKGSMALNKTIEAEEKKKRLSESDGANHSSMTAMKDNVDGVKLKMVRSKPRQSVKSNRPGSEKRVASGKKKNWATVVKKESEGAMKEKEGHESVHPTGPEKKAGEIQTEGVPLSSCSFFEKLQQGVRSYFASRNSLTDDKPKKKVTEGGIRTGAGVAKGGKEETKTRTQGKKIINKNKNWNSDLFYDRQRLKSNSEGQMSKFLNKKPKILEYVKRKKLYHPKKHYVRIQIPRKGYFYRSFEFGPNQSTTGGVNDLESVSLPAKSEIQIARMASTSPKSPDIHKKRIKKVKKKPPEDIPGSDEFSLVYNYLEAINFILNHQMIAQKFENEVNRVAMNWPVEISVSPEGVSLVSNENTPVSSEKLDSEVESPMCTPTDNLSNLGNSATKVQKSSDGLPIESAESYSVLESQIRNSTPTFNTPGEPGYVPDPSFEILLDYLRDSLGEEQRYGALEISPIMITNEKGKCNPKCESSPKFDVEGSKIDMLDGNFLHPLKENYCVATAFCEYNNSNPLKPKKSEEQFAELIIGDIDLHSELQNYLKETKNSAQPKKENISSLVNKDPAYCLNEEKSFLSEKNFHYPNDGDTFNTDAHFTPMPNTRTGQEEIKKMQTNEDASSRKIRLEGDSKSPPQEISDFVNQAHEKLGFSSYDSNEKEKLVSRLVSLLFKKHNEQLEGMLDCYEKVSPMKNTSRMKQSKSKLLHSNSTGCVAVEQTESKTRVTTPESNQPQKPEDVVAEEKVNTEEDADKNQTQNNQKWCPTLDELADIYGCVLKHNSKKKNSKRSKNLWSSTIMSILRDKLHEKQNKMDLINFTKTLKECFKPPDWKASADDNKNTKLQEYVNMFQEVLLSSLSIEQITYLNNVISHLQEEENLAQCCDYKKMQEPRKSSSSCETESDNDTPVSSTAKLQNTTKKQDPKGVKKQEPKTTKKAVVAPLRKTCLKKAALKKIIKPEEKNKKVALSPPAELEAVLKSTFNSGNNNGGRKTVDKILVNVKLCGSRVLVNDFSYIRDERSLCATSPTRNKVSELIIENIGTDRLKNDSLLDLSAASPKPKKVTMKRPIKKPQNIKIVLKSTKSKTQKPTRQVKNKNNDTNPPKQKDVQEPKNSKPSQECKTVNPVEEVIVDDTLHDNNNSFEYDQERLKVQHPIDAIIETSESKIIDHADSAENLGTSEKAPATTKDPKAEAAEVERILNQNMADKIFAKELLCDLGWNNDGLRRDKADDVKFPDDLQYKSKYVEKKKRKVPVGQHNAYFCYPSLVVQDHPVHIKKITKEGDLKGAKTVGSKALKKAESKVSQTTSSKGIKKTDSKMTKTTSPKQVKKTESNAVTTPVLKGTKKADSKGVKKTSSKVIKKTDLKENLKKPEAVQKFSSQVSSSERLAKRPERISKMDRTRQKQNENTVRSAKLPINVTPKRKVRKNSADSVLFLKMKGANDFNSETSSYNASMGSSFFEEVTKQRQKQELENSFKSGTGSETANSVDKYKNSPIVIFSTPGNSDDVSSQFAMIRSDSILKTLPCTPISPNKIDSVFKSNSDLKFYPGRISDSTEEQQPWVTFILTPQQQATAGLPTNQIKIVDKYHQTESEKTDMDEEDVDSDDSEDDQIPLSSIEKFIDELKETRLRVMKQEKELEMLEKLEKEKHEKLKSSKSAIVTKKVKLSSSDLTKNVTVKKHDCQKNKTKINVTESRRKSEKKSSGNEAILAKVIVNILQFLLDQKSKRLKLEKELYENSDGDSSQSDLENEAASENGAVRKWRRTEKTTAEMLNSVITGITKFDKLVKKAKLISAVKLELRKRAMNSGSNVHGLLELSKNISALKSLQSVKIGPAKKENEKRGEEQSLSFVRSTKRAEPVECPMRRGLVRDVGRKPSTYFDAEEKFKEELGGCVSPLAYESGEPFAQAVLDPLGVKKTEAENSSEVNSKTGLTFSDEHLFSETTVSKETEEIIYRKIYENLENNNVFYSMVLFDSLLKKNGVLDKDKKLRNVLQTVNQKCKNLMTEMERSAWIKLYFLLQEVSRVYDLEEEEKSVIESLYHYITNQFNRTLAFIGSNQLMNEKMANLNNFISQSKICSDAYPNNVVSKFMSRLSQIKNTLIPKITRSVKRFFEDETVEDSRNNLAHEIHAATAAHNLYSSSDEADEKESQIRFLKNQIRDQRLFIEYLTNLGVGSASSEVGDVKHKVSEKIMVLEKSMSNLTKGKDAGSTSHESLLDLVTNSLSLRHITSFFTLTGACRSSGDEEKVT